MRRNSYLIPRRTFLRGAGVSMALPLLDVMSPAISYAQPAEASPLRLCVLYKGCGVNPHAWDIVGGTETNFELSKILQPLAGVQDDILVVGNLDNQGSSDHMDAPGTFMSATGHKSGNRYSFDQRIADQVGSGHADQIHANDGRQRLEGESLVEYFVVRQKQPAPARAV